MTLPFSLAITTGHKPSAADFARAQVLCTRFAVPVVARTGFAAMFAREPVEAFYVVGTHHDAIVHRSGGSCFVEAGLLKMKLQEGAAHPFIRAVTNDGNAQPTAVFDATFGLGHDAMHLACCLSVVVTGSEHAALLVALHEEGLPRLARQYPALARVSVRAGDHLTQLKALAPHSVDVVVLDPMMKKPPAATPTFDALRAMAQHAPPSDEVFVEALRVARQRVVLKTEPSAAPPAAVPWHRVVYGARIRYHVHEVVD